MSAPHPWILGARFTAPLRRPGSVAKVASSATSWTRSLKAAAPWASDIEQAVLDWMAALGDVSVAELTAAIQTGDIGIVTASIWDDDQDADLDRALTDAMTPMLEAAATSQWASLQLAGSFSMDNPYSELWIAERVGNLVTEVSDSTKEMINDVILSGFRDHRTPAEMAAEIEQLVGLRTDQWAALVRKQTLWTQEGITGVRFAKMTAAEIEKKKAERALLISRTETINTHAHGALDAWRNARDRRLLPVGVRKVWIAATGSERTCPICMSLDGRTIDLDGQFSAVYQMTDVSIPKTITTLCPTAHPACRCGMGLEYTR